jgi:8-oxo-dGTP diphosphatase
VRLSAWIVGEWEGKPSNVAPDEHDEIRWFRPEKLPPLAHEIVGTALMEAMRDARPSAETLAWVAASMGPGSHIAG